MAIDDLRVRARRELEGAGLSMEAAAYLVDDRPPGGWDALVTKDLLRAELAEVRAEMAALRSDVTVSIERQLRAQTWRLATLVVAAQAVVVAAITAIGAAG